jgi:hypothetical protein
MAKLTMNQVEALYAVVDGRVQGRILDRTIPSLIKRKFIVLTRETGPVPAGPRVFSHAHGHMQGTVIKTYPVYKLTLTGYNEYTRLRKKHHQAKIDKLNKAFELDLMKAEGRLEIPF